MDYWKRRTQKTKKKKERKKEEKRKKKILLISRECLLKICELFLNDPNILAL